MDLSIILPAYNVEKYIEKSIASILEQNGVDYEIIIVNDGSTDRTLGVSEKLAKKYSEKIRLIDTVNQGSGYARNEGIPYASGEYIYFMDPDDSIEKGMFDFIFKKMVEKSFRPDIILFGFNEVNEKGEITLRELPRDLEDIYMSNSSIMDRTYEFYNYRILFAPWTKFIRREFLEKNNLRFTNQKTGQDAVFSTKLFSKAESMLWIPQNFYLYLKSRKGSAQTKKNPGKVIDGINIIKTLDKYILDSVSVKERLVGDFIVSVGINEIMNVQFPNKKFKNFREIVKDSPMSIYLDKIKFSKLSAKRKILYVIRRNYFLAYLFWLLRDRG